MQDSAPVTGHKVKYVVAHFMVGNTYPYTIEDWRADIELAYRHGFDGFALNVGKEDWQLERVADCYEAARQSGRKFTLFLSFDMASIPSSERSDVFLLEQYLERFGRHPNQFVYSGGVVVSTFSGENSLFGYTSLEDAWSYVKDVLEKSIETSIHFIPSFFINPERYPNLSCMDGYFHWNGAWPIHLTSESPRHEVHLPAIDSDKHHIRHLGPKTYMASISPWFFTHYGPESWNKNWIYRGDDHLLVRRWEYLIALREHIDIVQFISWNDYGESHYIASPRPHTAQPNSQAWVDGFSHEPWFELMSYFIRAFKHGQYPPITEDKVWLWGRPHLRDVVATEDSIGRPNMLELADDLFWVVVFAKGHATLTLSSFSKHDPQSRSYDIQAGISKLSHPMVPGGSMCAQMLRHGELVAVCDAKEEGFLIEVEPKMYNFNVYVTTSK